MACGAIHQNEPVCRYETGGGLWPGGMWTAGNEDKVRGEERPLEMYWGTDEKLEGGVSMLQQAESITTRNVNRSTSVSYHYSKHKNNIWSP